MSKIVRVLMGLLYLSEKNDWFAVWLVLNRNAPSIFQLAIAPAACSNSYVFGNRELQPSSCIMRYFGECCPGRVAYYYMRGGQSAVS